jgi:hypothetical protein
VNWVQADLADYDFGEGCWDAVVSIFCHLPSALRREVHRRIARGLRVGGIFILEAYGPEQLAFGTGGPRDLDLLCDLETLMADFSELKFLEGQQTHRPVIEGSAHTGMSAVVQLLARKREPKHAGH